MYEELILRLRRYLDDDEVSEDLRYAADAIDHDHDDVWEEAFDRIFREYHRVATAIFGDYNDPTANDCK